MLICGIIAITINIKCQKKHYEKNIYSFDNEKVRCINISKNKIKREMKYLDITGIEYKQSSLQKHHNLGNIILYNDVTVTGNNEILMRDVPNPMMYYNKIKEVIEQANIIDKKNNNGFILDFNIIKNIFSNLEKENASNFVKEVKSKIVTVNTSTTIWRIIDIDQKDLISEKI